MRDLLLLRERMNRLFDESVSRSRSEGLHPAPVSPAADCWEVPDGFVIVVDLPGAHEDDVGVAVSGATVSVRARRRGPEPRPASYHRMERLPGPFARDFDLGAEVDPDGVQATLKDGVLRVEVKRKAARTIPIRVGGA